MRNEIIFKTEVFPGMQITGPIKSMSEKEFAALGAESAVFVREISGEQLASFIPEAKIAPEDALFQMVMAADGSPVLVTDSKLDVYEWLDGNEVTLVQRH